MRCGNHAWLLLLLLLLTDGAPCMLLLLLLLQSRYLNSMTYLNRRSNDRWTSSNTELFYKALTIFGTDFTAIAKLFPGRDRCESDV
jgi:hypothetical protein